MQFSKALAVLLSLPALVFSDESSINAPANGTNVAPSASFPFDYTIGADYCASTYGFNVFIFTHKPTNFNPGETWNTGAFLGRYNEPNETADPDPPNQPPATFTMPDFSQSAGGFGTGKHASNKPVYLVVLEEGSTCDPALGVRFALHYVTLIYNATTSS